MVSKKRCCDIKVLYVRICGSCPWSRLCYNKDEIASTIINSIEVPAVSVRRLLTGPIHGEIYLTLTQSFGLAFDSLRGNHDCVIKRSKDS